MAFVLFFRVALKARYAEQQVYHTPRNKRNAYKWWWIYRKASPCQSQRISAQSSEATKSTREGFVYTEYRISNGGWGEHRAVSIEIWLWWIFDDFFDAFTLEQTHAPRLPIEMLGKLLRNYSSSSWWEESVRNALESLGSFEITLKNVKHREFD